MGFGCHQLTIGLVMIGGGVVVYGGAACFQVAQWTKDSLTIIECGGRFAWDGVGNMTTGALVQVPVLGNLAYYLWTKMMDGSRLVNLVPNGVRMIAPALVLA